MDQIIEINDLSKIFRIPHERRNTLKENFLNFHRKVKFEDFYALKNINLTVEKGDFIGIIGRNGSGKSTLLKIIANIYSPTIGKVIVNGSISPFLELGVGFNGDLSARENVYLNGIILGLSRKEVDRKYKKIVDYAELADFMDMKLKNFSSGMQVRLAFSVAIQADADIYLCDEVLAVGDASFQKKCYETFREFMKTGKTIIYVTHDLPSVKEFCNKTALLDHGAILSFGPTEEVVKKYLESLDG
ncbi:ABC transporter ATP-binding protein [Candidatus Peregrinibacteria bacterium]|nr:ABC transporter ATP-binding protein [Candidatus Peregrinibacteria bacterium]